MTSLKLALSLICFGSLMPAQKADSLPAPPAQRLPAWWLEEGLVMAGSWESPSFRLRRASEESREAILEGWQHEQSEEFARKLKDLGVNFVMIPIYKGFGLAEERSAMEQAKRFTEICHGMGMKVGVYAFSGTIGYETVLLEEPNSGDWLVRDFLGRFLPYGRQYYRRWVNRSHPGVRQHLKEVVRYAIEEAKVDLIHMDNYGVGPGYEPYSVSQFRAYLNKRYSPQEFARRYGFTKVEAIEPPPLDADTAYSDPLVQDFLDYRAVTMAESYRELGEYTRSLNPEVVMEANPGGYYGHAGSRPFANRAVDHMRLLEWGGAFWDEGRRSRIEDGVLFSRFRSMKMGRQFNNAVFFYTADKVAMAESLANNLQSAGCPIWFEGGVIGSSHHIYGEKQPLPPEIPAYMRFFRSRQELYREAKEVADVGVLRTFANDAYSPPETRDRRAAFEQALYQGKVPFTLVPGNYPGDLTRFRVLVLADLALLPDSLVPPIRDYVERGGGLVITGQSGEFDENHRRRAARAFADLFDAPLAGAAVRAQKGRGRAVYIPKVVIPEEFRAVSLPHNRAELLEAVRWAAGQPLQAEVKAPETVATALYEQPSGRRVLHLVNYDEHRPAENIHVVLQAPKRLSSVTLLSPDSGAGQARPLSYKQTGREVRFTVPKLETYAVVAAE